MARSVTGIETFNGKNIADMTRDELVEALKATKITLGALLHDDKDGKVVCTIIGRTAQGRGAIYNEPVQSGKLPDGRIVYIIGKPKSGPILDPTKFGAV